MRIILYLTFLYVLIVQFLNKAFYIAHMDLVLQHHRGFGVQTVVAIRELDDGLIYPPHCIIVLYL